MVFWFCFLRCLWFFLVLPKLIRSSRLSLSVLGSVGFESGAGNTQTVEAGMKSHSMAQERTHLTAHIVHHHSMSWFLNTWPGSSCSLFLFRFWSARVMEDSGTQCRDSRSRNWSEESAASWQPSEFLSWKGSQIFDGDEGVLPASADAAWEWC